MTGPETTVAVTSGNKQRNPLLWVLLFSGVVFFLFVVIGGVWAVRYAVKGSGDGYESSSTGLADSGPGNIGVIEIKGLIRDSKRTLERIHRFQEDDKIKAIILRIDSPGGVVGPSQEIYDAVTKIDKKPVIASLGGVAASGALYIAVGAQKIVANPGTLTGSIGVIMEQVNLKDLYEWAKVKRFSLKAGKYKDAGAEYRDLTDEEKALFQATLDDVHVQFKEAVAKGRKLSMDAVNSFADGRIMTGRQALQIKLVDQLGNFDAAVELAAKEAKIKGKPKPVYPAKRGPAWLSMLTDHSGDEMEERLNSILSNFLGQKLLFVLQ